MSTQNETAADRKKLLDTIEGLLIDSIPGGDCINCAENDEWCEDHQELLRLPRELFYENQALMKALALANSMICSGERHSPTSERIINEALFPTPHAHH